MSRAGYIDWVGDFTNVWNSNKVAGTKKLQKAHKLTPANGNYGPATHEVLRRHLNRKKDGWAFDQYAVQIYNDARIAGTVAKPTEVRAFLVQVNFELVKYRDRLGYDQRRAILPIIRAIHQTYLADPLDCSGKAIYTRWLAKEHFLHRGIYVPSPDEDYFYSGYGNTWSLYGSGAAVTVTNAQIGDLAFYGQSIGHVAEVVKLNPTMVVSMGSEKGPLYLPLFYRGDFHGLRRYPLIRK